MNDDDRERWLLVVSIFIIGAVFALIQYFDVGI